MTATETGKKKLTVHLEYDHDPENPVEMAGWTAVSFGTRHANFKHPDNFFDGLDKDRKPVGLKQGLRNKLRAGTAFWLGYYEHGLCQWALQGEQHQCRWDSCNLAGLLMYEGKPKDIGSTYEEREQYARSLLEEYTNWCNGQVFAYYIEDEEGEVVDSCGGYYDGGEMVKMIRQENPDAELEFVGPAADLACYN